MAIGFLVHLVPRADTVEALPRFIGAMLPLMRSVEGTVSVTVLKEDGGDLYLLEVFRDQEALTAHIAHPELKARNVELAALLEKPLSARRFEVGDELAA